MKYQKNLIKICLAVNGTCKHEKKNAWVTQKLSKMTDKSDKNSSNNLGANTGLLLSAPLCICNSKICFHDSLHIIQNKQDIGCKHSLQYTPTTSKSCNIDRITSMPPKTSLCVCVWGGGYDKELQDSINNILVNARQRWQ